MIHKKDLLGLVWFTGLFEGEGSFVISRGVQAKGISLASTDRDVLEAIQKMFGGRIYKQAKRKEHWKQAWVWHLNNENAKQVVIDMQPYLSQRRLERSKEWLSLIEESNRVLRERMERNKEMIEMQEKGMTHKQIAEHFNLDRTTVTKTLKKYGAIVQGS